MGVFGESDAAFGVGDVVREETMRRDEMKDKDGAAML